MGVSGGGGEHQMGVMPHPSGAGCGPKHLFQAAGSGAGEPVQLAETPPWGAGTSTACSMQWAGFFPSIPLGL